MYVFETLYTSIPLLQKAIKMKRIFYNILSVFTLAILLASCSTTERDKEVQAEKAEVASVQNEKPIILFFGNSLTAGYGIEQDLAFPGLIQDRLDSLGKEYKVINGGLSGETTAGGVSRIDWFLEDEPAIFVLELGGNDGLRGIKLSETKKNLEIIIEKVQSKYPETKIILAGMQIPPNMGQEYTEEFQSIYPEVAESKNVELIPFLLQNVGGIKELNLPDGIHPTEEGHKIVLENVWEYLKDDV